MADFTMPSLGADMEEGTVLEWLVSPGDSVHKGDIVAVVDTAKAAVEVETFVEGVVDSILVQPGERVPVGTPLAHITTPPGAPSSTGAGRTAEAPRPAPPPPTVLPTPAEPRVSSPLVRQLASDLGVDLTTVTGTGTGHVITRRDVRSAAGAVTPVAGSDSTRTRTPERTDVASPRAGSGDGKAVAATPYARRLAAELGVDLDRLRGVRQPVRAADVRAAAEAEPAVPAAPTPQAAIPERPEAEQPSAERAAAMRSAIATLMTRANQEIPHYFLTNTVDLGVATAWMKKRNQELPVSRRLVPAALLLRATALALRRHPELNGYWLDGAFVPGSGIHLGVAISLRAGGLVAPAIHDAADLELGDLMARLRDLVARARAGRLRRDEMADPTITVTNLGDQGVESVYGVIYPPQVALVGFGRIVDRPWAHEGMLGVRPVTVTTLAADHRATDGFTGARFLAAIETLLQKPEEL